MLDRIIEFLQLHGKTILISGLVIAVLWVIFKLLSSIGKGESKINPTIEDHEEQAYWKDKWRRDYEYPN